MTRCGEYKQPVKPQAPRLTAGVWKPEKGAYNMETYIFKTTATMKEYNRRKWWIDSGIVPEMKITAENLKTALAEYRQRVQDQHYISISNNAMRYKNPMYIDRADGEPLQVGYVITAKTGFEDRDNYRYTDQYIDLWVTVYAVTVPNFEGV